jgi:hypothetical protein
MEPKLMTRRVLHQGVVQVSQARLEEAANPQRLERAAYRWAEIRMRRTIREAGGKPQTGVTFYHFEATGIWVMAVVEGLFPAGHANS